MHRHFAAGLELGFPFFGNITLRHWIIRSDSSIQSSDSVFKGSPFDINPPQLYYYDILAFRGPGIWGAISAMPELCRTGIMPCRVVPWGWTDRHDEANSRFSQFCERALKPCSIFLKRTSPLRISTETLTSMTFPLFVSHTFLKTGHYCFLLHIVPVVVKSSCDVWYLFDNATLINIM